MSEPFGDEVVWQARYDRLLEEVRFWRNLALLIPYAVPVHDTPPRAVTSPPASSALIAIPHQRTRHPAAARLANLALRNPKRGGRP